MDCQFGFMIGDGDWCVVGFQFYVDVFVLVMQDYFGGGCGGFVGGGQGGSEIGRYYWEVLENRVFILVLC